MPDSDETQADASAEKAYAKASESIGPAKPEPLVASKPETQAGPDGPTLEIPSVKPTAEATSHAAAKLRQPSKSKPKPKPKLKLKGAPKPAPAPPGASAAKPKSVAKVAPVAPKPKPAAFPKVAAKRISAGSKSPAPQITTATTNSAPAATKDEHMTISSKVTSGLESMMSDAQAKAKDAFEKSSAFFGDYADFAKGNIEAVVQSGKILAEGLQDMGTSFVAEGRTAFESASSDIKEMAAAKSPTDLIQLQSEMVRKNFDSAVAYGSKNTEAMIKLVSEVMAPLSSRMSLAVDKVRQAAI